MTNKRYICIHGHFYQPPRENPWLEAIELQDSASPYHDWNERITAECYGTCTASRILDGDGRIIKIVNNYAKISFNFGPTLLSWLQKQQPQVYQAILEADKESGAVFGGHGCALAQAYNHIIMPLANARDKNTQIFWGIKDFEHRFGRRPEGLWLPETAVDLETLEVLARHDISFTILAPHQAKRVRAIGESQWAELRGGGPDPTRAYRCVLPSGRFIHIFFYDGPASSAVAFENLLKNGEGFAKRILGLFSEQKLWHQLVHIATDGETYGHHHRHGDMALAYALDYIERHNLAQITNYAQYLELAPATHEVEILENTSWSCVHGIERWRSDCGCHAGGKPGWNQKWREPLREALNWLRDELTLFFEEASQGIFKDCRQARDHYIEVILDRSPENVKHFFERFQAGELDEAAKIRGLKLLEMQRQALLMFTSCGWFFNEISGIETMQIIQYASCALGLAEEAGGKPLEEEFLRRLAKAQSNIVEHGDGGILYKKFVKSGRVSLNAVAVHFAVSSIFKQPPRRHSELYCYKIHNIEQRRFAVGKTKLALGHAVITSEITLEAKHLAYAVLHFGDHHVSAGVIEFPGEARYDALVRELPEFFLKADFSKTLALMKTHFDDCPYTLESLFRDERHALINTLLESTLTQVENMHNQVYDNSAPLMRFLVRLRFPVPRVLQEAAETVLNRRLERALGEKDLALDHIKALFEEAKAVGAQWDRSRLDPALIQAIMRLAERLLANPMDLRVLNLFNAMVEYVRSFPFELDLWRAQNLYYRVLRSHYAFFLEGSKDSDEFAKLWIGPFEELGRRLGLRFPS